MAVENPFHWSLIRAKEVVVVKEAFDSEREGERVSNQWIENKVTQKIGEAQHGNISCQKEN